MADSGMDHPRRVVGFLPSVARTPVGQLVWPEGLLALVVGLGGGIALLGPTTVAERRVIVGDTLEILGVLLGIVFAAFALLIALFSDEYIALLKKTKDGVLGFLRPFMIAIGFQVAALLLAIGYRASAAHLNEGTEHGVFLAWAFVAAFALFDVVALARSVMMHGLTRSRLVKEDPGDATVHKLRDQPGSP